MALPAERTPLSLVSQECDYGSNTTGADNLILRAPISTSCVHPVEAAERSYKQRQDELGFTKAQQTFGLGFALHLRHQRAATRVSSIGHMSGVLPRHNAMHDALTGRDLELDFSDTLGQDLFTRHTPHEIMEHKLTGRI